MFTTMKDNFGYTIENGVRAIAIAGVFAWSLSILHCNTACQWFGAVILFAIVFFGTQIQSIILEIDEQYDEPDKEGSTVLYKDYLDLHQKWDLQRKELDNARAGHKILENEKAELFDALQLKIRDNIYLREKLKLTNNESGDQPTIGD